MSFCEYEESKQYYKTTQVKIFPKMAIMFRGELTPYIYFISKILKRNIEQNAKIFEILGENSSKKICVTLKPAIH